MTPLDKLERRFGRYAVPNVTVGLILGQVLVFVASQLDLGGRGGSVLERIVLVPELVLSGEVWRLVTFLFTPPSYGLGLGLLFTIIFWMVFYMMGNALEATWGPFRYNVFLGVGYLASVAAAFLVPGAIATNAFLQATVFLAFARLFPDFEFLLMFIVPIKVKWLALLTWLIYGYTLIVGDFATRAMVIASVTNYLVFFGREHLMELRQGQRRRSYQSKAAPARVAHKCRVCGLTSDDEPKTSFRYCSKCAGQCCYCPEHINNHEHVVE